MAWAAIRFGLRGVTAGVAALSILAYWHLMSVLGPEQRYISQSPANLWIFVGILSLTSVILAAVMAELRRRELLVAENESRLRAFTDALPDIAFVLSSRGEVRDVFASGAVNKARHAIPLEAEVRGCSLDELLPEVTVRDFLQTISTALRFGALQTLEYAIGGADGKTFWFEARVMPMQTAGTPDGCVVWVAYDITGRKQAEAALRRRDEILLATAQAKNLLLTHADFDEALSGALRLVGGALDADRAFIFEIRRPAGAEELAVRCCFEWRRGKDMPSFRESGGLGEGPLEAFFPGWYRHFSGHGVIRGPVSSLAAPVRRRLQEAGSVSILAVPVWVDRVLWGFFGVDVVGRSREWQSSEVNALRVMSSSMSGLVVIRDRENALRRERDRADSASSAKGEFLAMMSHEIRTPMNAIVGYSDILAQTKLDEHQHEQVGIIKRSGRALLELINNILDYSKIESRSLELEATRFSLEQVVCEALENVLVRAKEKGIRLDFKIGEDLSAHYVGDPYRLRQILTNLLNNAVKFTEEGFVELQVERLRERATDGREDLHFQVVDTGVGIPREKFERLFRAFSQVDSSTTREYGGTGLGLVIARRLVETMDGKIWVESTEGEGSTFHFTVRFSLPGAGESDGSVPVRQRAGDGMQKSFGKRHPLRLLVCEDDPDNQWVLREMLQSLGYRPDIAGDGGEAQLRLRYHDYDAVLMDVQMPEVDGLELTRRLRRGDLGEELSDRYVIACTAFAMNEDRDRCLAAGMNDYLSKPLVVGRLKEALARAHEAVAGADGVKTTKPEPAE
jgi:PAS domain S-box-containing protein